MSRLPRVVGSALVVLLSTPLARTSWLAAQAPDRSWRPAARVEGGFEYDDNPFLLNTDKQAKLESPSAGDRTSGRFEDMESVSDQIVIPALVLGAKGPGLGGRTLEIRGNFAYEYNLQNTRRKHADLGLMLQHSISRAGRVRFDAGWQTSAFSKNYLADAVDLNGDGNIASGERRYDAALQRQIDLSLGYKHRLLTPTKRRRFGLAAELAATYGDKRYDAPFSGRTLTGPGGAVALAAEFGRRWTLGVNYSYAKLEADRTREVLILDETDFGQDLNGNGNATNTNARTVQAVDRSRREQHIGATLEGALGKRITATLGYDRRTRSFTSGEPFDVADNGRDDKLNEFAAALTFGLGRAMELEIGGKHLKQSTNRAGDPASTGEVDDYARNIASTALRYRF